MNGSHFSPLASAPHRYARLASLSLLLTMGLTACDDSITEPSVPDAPQTTPQASVASVEPARGDPVPDQYIVVLKDNVSAAHVSGKARELAAAHGGKLIHTYTSALKGFTVHLPAQAASALAANPNVAVITQDEKGTFEGSATPEQSATSEQSTTPWGLDRIDQRGLPLSGLFWAPPYAMQNPVNIYIIDTGIDVSHPDFGGRATSVYDVNGGDGRDCSSSLHGTSVARIAGGTVYGVAKGARLHGLKIWRSTCANGTTVEQINFNTSDLLAAMDWLLKNYVKPAVVNFSVALYSASLGSTPTFGGRLANDAAAKLAAAGVFVAAGAGNENVDACGVAPASAQGVAAVAGSDRTDTRWSESNYGPCVDLYAPAVNVFGSSGTGTSYASPHVAGVGALYKATYGDAPSQQILDWMISTATPDVIKNNVAGTPNRLLHSVTTLQDNIHVFSAAFYLQQYPDLKAAYGTNYAAARDHWLRVGLPVEGRRGSREFDVRFYLDQYPDLKSAYGTDYLSALEHWLETGIRVEGRRGSREFDVQWYLQQYPDLKAAYGTDYVAAFDHWMLRGLPVEGRRGSREFDVVFYLRRYPELADAFGSNYAGALDHWIRGGLPVEGRRGSREVDVRFYINQISDLKIAYANYAAALDHWIRRGLPVEGRRASAEFDVRYYLATYGDIRAAYGATNFHAAFDHWVRAGILEGRSGAPPPTLVVK